MVHYVVFIIGQLENIRLFTRKIRIFVAGYYRKTKNLEVFLFMLLSKPVMTLLLLSDRTSKIAIENLSTILITIFLNIFTKQSC